MDMRVVRRTREIAERLMEQHGLTVLGWEFMFNKNKTRAGVCRYPFRGKPGVIELSIFYVQFNPEEKIVDTILHEIAHALTPGHMHDDVWKAKCVEIGAKPQRCYGNEVKMLSGGWKAACGVCSKVYTRHRRPKPGLKYNCMTCGREKGMLDWKPVS